MPCSLGADTVSENIHLSSHALCPPRISTQFRFMREAFRVRLRHLESCLDTRYHANEIYVYIYEGRPVHVCVILSAAVVAPAAEDHSEGPHTSEQPTGHGVPQV